jgi:hypothetical protein
MRGWSIINKKKTTERKRRERVKPQYEIEREQL